MVTPLSFKAWCDMMNFWTKLKQRWSLVRTRLMLVMAAIMSAVGALQASDIVPLFPAEYARFAPVLAPILVAVLHVLTADRVPPKE